MIDSQLQQELRERFNPDGSMLRKQQLRMLEILLYIDKVCKDNNINYWLSSGTLLGAVRHGGFIPWDDDLDIEMMREDYDRFQKVFSNNEDYVLQTYKSDKNYLLPFAKVRDLHSELDELGNNVSFKYKGCFVDIFILERSPRFVYVIFGSLLYLLQRMQCGVTNNYLLKMTYLLKQMFYSLIFIAKPIFNILPYKTLNHTYGCGPRWKSRDIKHIFPLTQLSFEGYMFPAPFNYKSYLKRMFGNYELLPNLDKVRIHSNNCNFF